MGEIMSRKERGATLIEILLAMVILSIALLPLLSVLNINIIGTTQSKNMQVAINLARAEIEKVKNFEDIYEVKSVEYEKVVNGVNWRVVREVISGSTPLQIWVKIYRNREKTPLITLFTLKENISDY